VIDKDLACCAMDRTNDSLRADSDASKKDGPRDKQTAASTASHMELTADDATVVTSNRELALPNTATITERQTSTTVQTLDNINWAQPYVRSLTTTTTTSNSAHHRPPNTLHMDRTPPPPPTRAALNASANDDGILALDRNETSNDDPFHNQVLFLTNDNSADLSTSRETDLLQEPLLIHTTSDSNENKGMWTWLTELGQCGNEEDLLSDRRPHPAVPPLRVVIFVLVIVAIFAVIRMLVLDSSRCNGSASGHSKLYPTVLRYQHLLECVEQASPQTTGRAEMGADDGLPSPRQTAIDWFLTGPGRDVVIDGDCHGDFATLYSLLMLRESLRVPDASWYNDKNSIRTTRDVCIHWTQVNCSSSESLLGDDSGPVFSVTKLSLENSNLAGSFPVEMVAGLQLLTSLQVFSNADLVGTLPEFLSQLTRLEQLELHSTGLSGSVPTSWGRLTNLQDLLLHNTSITGTVPSEVCQLTSSKLQTVRVPISVQCSCCK
jgi:hypothetical protein